MASPEFDAHGRTHRTVEIGVDAPTTDSVTTPERDTWPDDAFDNKTNKIVLGIGAVGLLGFAAVLAKNRLQQRNKE